MLSFVVPLVVLSFVVIAMMSLLFRADEKILQNSLRKMKGKAPLRKKSNLTEGNLIKAKKQTTATAKHHKVILRHVKEIMASESWDAVLSDVKLAEALQRRGIYASAGMVRVTRLANNIPASYERKMKAFARQTASV